MPLITLDRHSCPAAAPPARAAGKPRVCVLSLSPIADDPRVRRQAEAFHRAGWQVVAVGMPGARSAAPEWPILTRDSLPPSQPEPSVPPAVNNADAAVAARGGDRSPVAKLRSARRLLPWVWEEYGLASEPPLRRYRRVLAWSVRPATRAAHRARHASRLLATRLRPEMAQDIYWSFSGNILDIYACAGRLRADVWLANDWTMLPLAARLARAAGGVYGYDTHEFAAEEYGHKLKWRFWNRPMVCALERAFIGDAAVVSAVSAGIAERLERMYRLPRPAMVIRNTPEFQEPRFRQTGEPIRVLYHGILAPGRGLEASIDSVARWRPEFTLTLRGPGNAGFIAALHRRIARLGLADRVAVAPPVPMTELVREAAAFDVGLFALSGNSGHNRFALPNKFFEYVMAGLALCVSDLPEMARLVRQYVLGVTIAAPEPEAIAAAVNRLDRAAIDAYKHRSVAAARELCWECEAGRLVTAYEAALAATVAG